MLAYDFNGKEQWRKPLNTPVVEFGASASPILAGDLLIQVCDQDLDSYLLAVDRRTGKTVWDTTIGNRANGVLKGKILTLRPAVIDDAPVVPVTWVCGYAAAPDKMSVKGTDSTSVPASVPSLVQRSSPDPRVNAAK